MKNSIFFFALCAIVSFFACTESKQNTEWLETSKTTSIDESKPSTDDAKNNLNTAWASLKQDRRLRVLVEFDSLTDDQLKYLAGEKYAIEPNLLRHSLARTVGADAKRMSTWASKNGNELAQIISENNFFIKKVVEGYGIKYQLKGTHQAIKDFDSFDGEGGYDSYSKNLSQSFLAFYKKYGKLKRFPIEGHESTDEPKSFWVDMAKIVDKYDLPDGRNGFVPASYKSWLMGHRWKEKIGDGNYKKLMDEIADILQ